MRKKTIRRLLESHRYNKTKQKSSLGLIKASKINLKSFHSSVNFRSLLITFCHTSQPDFICVQTPKHRFNSF